MAQILATGYQRAAKSSRVSVGGTALAFASWSAQVQGDDIVTDNFLSYDEAAAQAYHEGILGFIGCDGSYGGDWDASLNPVDYDAVAPPGLYPRDDLADVEFYTSIVDSITPWSFPYQRIRSSNCGAEVNNEVTFTAGYKSQGPFSFPTGSE
jgi:hypothetical protein